MNIETLIGKRLTSIETAVEGSGTVVFNTEDGKRYALWHHQDCCEDVRLVDVVGDPDDLVGRVILTAEESSGETPDDLKDKHSPSESYKWTFYRIGTSRGLVTLRWLGQSNGYYSESVDFEEITLEQAR